VRYFDGPGAASLHLPPVDLPDLAKKPPKQKFVKPEKKTGVPTASKVKPQSKGAKAPSQNKAPRVLSRTKR
jgi:excinuclease ABC subunit A